MLSLPSIFNGNKHHRTLFILLALIGLVSSTFLFYYESKREQRVYDQYNQLIKESNQANSEALAENILTNTKSIQLLRNLPYVQDFISTPLSSSHESAVHNNIKKQITTIFVALLDQEQEIRQARLILNDGAEYIRVERSSNGLMVTPPNLLQSKEDRDYFKLGMNLPNEEVYVSQISPNYEHGKVEFPIWPTYRIFTNIQNQDGDILGLLILNIDASKLLKKLNYNEQSSLLPFENYLIDNNGYYIAAPKPALLFGKDLNLKQNNWFSHTGNSTPLRQSDKIQTKLIDNNYLFSAKKISFTQNLTNNPYYLLTGIPTHKIDQEILAQRKELLAPIITCVLLIILLVFFFLRHIRNLEKLYLDQSHFKAIISNSSDAILSIDHTGKILNWNHAATILFGLNDTEAIGHNFLELIDSSSEQVFNLDFINHILEKNINERIEVIPKNKHATERVLLLTLCPIDTTDDIHGSVALIIRDITHQKVNQKKLESLNLALDDKVKTRTKQLEAEKQKALKANQIKSMFVANISHEIRTPLNGVSGLLALARDKRNHNKRDDYLKMAQESAQTLNILIDDLLDFSKIESGKLELNPKPFFMLSLLELAITSISFLVKNKNIELILDTSRVEVNWIMLDEHRIKQILTNLLSNAIKFTNKGEVILTASTYNSQEDKNKVVCEFQVSDSGVGISKEQQSKLFKPFVQASAGIANKYGGTGLGLSISKQLCELMDGSLTLTSLTGEGSNFKAFIQSEKVQTKLAQSANKTKTYEDQNIAIFIENDHVRRVLRNQLHNWKAKTFLIQNEEQFSEHIKQNTLTLALIDQRFFIQRLEQQLKEHDIRVVYLTGINQTSDIEGSFITKPILPSALEAIMSPSDEPIVNQAQSSAIKNHSSTKSNVSRLTNSSSVQATQNKPGKEQQMIFVVDDNEINLIVGSGILSVLPANIETASNGEDILAKLTDLPVLPHLPVILMDCQMPIMDGYKATRLIREGKAGDWLKNTPIIAMTADAMTENKADCTAAGMDDFIGKPFDPETLKALVLQWSHKKP